MNFSEKAYALEKLKILDTKPWIAEETDINNSGDDRLIIVIKPNAANFIQQESIAKILAWLIDRKVVMLVACDGAWEEIDTKLRDPELVEKYSDIENTQPELIRSLFQNVILSPIEYCLIVSPRSFIFYGADDKDLYKKSAQFFQTFAYVRDYHHKKGLWNTSQFETRYALENKPDELVKKREFYAMEETRATVILENLLNRMKKEQPPFQTAVLLCCGYLPELVCKEMAQRGISYARIKAHTEESDAEWEKYLKRINSQMKSVETL
jgi:hypothetical protein